MKSLFQNGIRQISYFYNLINTLRLIPFVFLNRYSNFRVLNYFFVKHLRLIIVVALTFLSGLVKGQSKYGPNDTLMVAAIVVDGDTIPIKWLTGVYVWKGGKRQKKEWTRLRNAVYVTYPYARKAGQIWNDIENRRPAYSKKELKKYIDSREKELKKEFTKPMKNLSVYQGKILMKLINRETGGQIAMTLSKH